MTSLIYDTAFRAKCRDDTSAPTEDNAAASLGQEQDPDSLAEEETQKIVLCDFHPVESQGIQKSHSHTAALMEARLWDFLF